MTRWVRWLGLAVAVAWMTFAAAPAYADFTVCNKSSYKVFVAFGYWDGSQKSWTSEGWWTLEKGDCAAVYEKNLSDKKYYVYAESTDHQNHWSGDYPFCASDDEFTIVGDSDCKSRGYYAIDFFEVEVGDRRDYTQDIVD